jgi:hypothetical protein
MWTLFLIVLVFKKSYFVSSCPEPMLLNLWRSITGHLTTFTELSLSREAVSYVATEELPNIL